MNFDNSIEMSLQSSSEKYACHELLIVQQSLFALHKPSYISLKLLYEVVSSIVE